MIKLEVKGKKKNILMFYKVLKERYGPAYSKTIVMLAPECMNFCGPDLSIVVGFDIYDDGLSVDSIKPMLVKGVKIVYSNVVGRKVELFNSTRDGSVVVRGTEPKNKVVPFGVRVLQTAEIQEYSDLDASLGESETLEQYEERVYCR